MAAVQAAAQAFEAGQLDHARRGCEKVLAVAPGEPNCSQILALIFLQGGNAAGAVTHLRNAKRNAPNHPPVLNMLGVALGMVGERAEARKNFEKAKRIDPGYLDARFNLAQVELDDGLLEAAQAEFEEILSYQPLNSEALAGLAKVALLGKDPARAASLAEQALTFDASNAAARLSLAEAHLREGAFEEARRIALETANLNNASPADRAYAWGFAADAMDRLGAYDDAFAAYQMSNNLQAPAGQAAMNQPPSAYHPQTVRRLIEFVEGGAGDAPPPCPADEPSPAFLIGFPRSGTTLLEQVLLAHPAVLSLGERTAFETACGDLVPGGEGFAKLAHLTAAEAAAVRARYWKELAALGAMPGPDQLYLDKMPANTALLPVIAKVFPHAKVLFAIRDPRDVVLSCYQQRFVMNQAMVQMLSLESAADYYDIVMTLAEKTRETMPLNLRDVRYDDVVANLEGETRATVAYLGLPWNDDILGYREQLRTRNISTPSAEQVSEPIYSRALGKWRHYERHLAPVLDRLAPWVAHWGYSDAAEQHE